MTAGRPPAPAAAVGSDLLALTGRVAVVSGGAGGIGHAVARRLADAGARVVSLDLPGASTDDDIDDVDIDDHHASGNDVEHHDDAAAGRQHHQWARGRR